MTQIPDYVARGGDEYGYTIQEIDNLRKVKPTGNEALDDSMLNTYWHELMSVEEDYLKRVKEVQAQLKQANEEINRRVYRATLVACVATVEELTK